MPSRELDFRSSSTGDFEWISPLGVEASTETLVSYCDHGGDPQSVLDVGCGDGTLLTALAERYPDRTFHGIDPAEDAVRSAKERVDSLSNATVEQSVLDPSTHSAEFLYAINMIQDTPDPKAAVADLYAALDADGMAVVTAPLSGRERLFAEPAPRYDHATLTETENRTIVDMGEIRAELHYGDELTDQRLYAVDGDDETLIVDQYTIQPGALERFCRQAGFEIVDRETLPCNPAGIAYILELYGFTAEASEWRERTERWRDDPAAYTDDLPTVPALLLRA